MKVCSACRFRLCSTNAAIYLQLTDLFKNLLFDLIATQYGFAGILDTSIDHLFTGDNMNWYYGLELNVFLITILNSVIY